MEILQLKSGHGGRLSHTRARASGIQMKLYAGRRARGANRLPVPMLTDSIVVAMLMNSRSEPVLDRLMPALSCRPMPARFSLSVPDILVCLHDNSLLVRDIVVCQRAHVVLL